jgi:hypothetical protein
LKINTIITASFLIFGCEAPQKAIDEVSHLKELGYNTFFCDKLRSEPGSNVIEVYTYVEPQTDDKHMIAARCKEMKCSFEEIKDNIIPSEFICATHNLNNTYDNVEPEIILTYNVGKFNDIKN